MRSYLHFIKNPDFCAKSGPNLDQFAQKSPDPDQSPEIWTKVGVNGDGLGVVPQHLLSLELLLLACTVELFAQTWSKEAVSQSIFALLGLLVLSKDKDKPKLIIM